MNIPDAIVHIHTVIAAWHAEEIIYVAAGEAEQARECRLRIATLEQLERDLEAA